MTTRLDLEPANVIGAGMTVPVGIFGADLIADNIGVIKLNGVPIFAEGLFNDSIVRVLVGFAALLMLVVADAGGFIEDDRDLTGRLVEGAAWGATLGAVSSVSLQVFTIINGPLTFTPDLSAQRTNRDHQMDFMFEGMRNNVHR